MIAPHRLSLWLAALIACIGMACIALFVLTRRPGDDLLYVAVIAAMLSLTSAIVGVFLVCREADGRKRQGLSQFATPQPGPIAESDLSEQIKLRQDVLSERLNFDEPRFCSQARA